jgi:hypothetical protein
MIKQDNSYHPKSNTNWVHEWITHSEPTTPTHMNTQLPHITACYGNHSTDYCNHSQADMHLSTTHTSDTLFPHQGTEGLTARGQALSLNQQPWENWSAFQSHTLVILSILLHTQTYYGMGGCKGAFISIIHTHQELKFCHKKYKHESDT